MTDLAVAMPCVTHTNESPLDLYRHLARAVGFRRDFFSACRPVITQLPSNAVTMVGFKMGNFVRLQGLSNAAYNGKLAIIKSLCADENTGRFTVKFRVVDEVAVASNLSREMAIKPENMARACDCCHQAGADTMQYCGKCKNAAYCNAECQ